MAGRADRRGAGRRDRDRAALAATSTAPLSSVEEGLQAALSTYRGSKRLYQRKLDGEREAKLIALACSEVPDGKARWTLRLLAERMPPQG